MARSCRAACITPGSPAPIATTRTVPSCGNALCGRCHMPAKFDVAEHHHHEPDSAGAQCVNCHMPTKTYMVVDVRRDHSFRVPRPDLSVSLGTPNACTQCHTGRSVEWAAQTVAGWYTGGRPTNPHYGRRACRGHGAIGTDAPAASGGPRCAARPCVDRAGDRRPCSGAVTRAGARRARPRRRADPQSIVGARKAPTQLA